MVYSLTSGLEITRLQSSTNSLVEGSLKAKTRVPRPSAEAEGPADYTFTYNRDTGDLKLWIIKWSGVGTHVAHPLASDARADIRSDLKQILPGILPLADEAQRVQMKADADLKERQEIEDVLADLLIEIRKTSTNPALFKDAISGYEKLVKSLDETEEYRGVHKFTYETARKARRASLGLS